MKLVWSFLLFFSSFNFGFCQKDGNSSVRDSIVSVFFENTFSDYYKVQSFLNSQRLSDEELSYLLEKSKEEGNVFGQIYALNRAGGKYRRRSKYDTSEELHQEALNLARKGDFIEAEIVTLNCLGVVHRRQDKIKSALNYHQRALELADKLDGSLKDVKKSKSMSENSIGNIYLVLKQYKLALEKFQKSIRTQIEFNDLKGLAINYQNMGLAYQKLGLLDTALHNFNKSLNYNERNRSDIGKVICHNSISQVLILQKKYEEAYQFIQEVVPLAIKLKDDYYTSDVFNTLGYCQIKKGDLKAAERSIRKSLDIAAKTAITHNVSLSYQHLSEVYDLRKDYKKAFQYYKKSIEVKNKVFNDRNVLYVNNLINKYDNEVKNNEIKSLARENEITKLKLTENRNILIIALVSIALFGVLLYAIYGQRLLSNDKKILMLEQEALQNQMNPHFVFNALNSIKLYIINNEQKNAVYYLNKFSKLIRSILESSKTKEVTLSEELKTMSLYMSIENIRFSNEIMYLEEIEKGIQLDQVKVPPLILQPFLENAIWHGLSSKKGNKKVVLNVSAIGNTFIHIEITDNGIGREEALKIKKSKSLKRRSIGIELTKQRLKNFSNEFQNSYVLTYIDLIDEKELPKGTRVSLKIPVS